MEPMRVLLVDDHALFRKALTSLVDAQEDMEVVGEAGDGQEALQVARDLMPDLILMDIQMPVWDGLKATRMIKAEMPYVHVVMLTVSDEDEDLFEAIKVGAQGYLLKNMEPEEFFELLKGVSRGEAPMSRLTATKLLQEFGSQGQQMAAPATSGENLTLREQEVLHLVAQGASNKEIAAQLFIAENTVKNHLRNIMAKLHAKNRVQAAAYALRGGLMEGASGGEPKAP